MPCTASCSPSTTPACAAGTCSTPTPPHLGRGALAAAAVAGAVTATIRLTVTDRLTYGVLHGDPAPEIFVVDPATGRTGLLDCGASGTGPLIYDVAAAVVYAGGPEPRRSCSTAISPPARSTRASWTRRCR